MKNWVTPTNSASSTMYCAAAPTSTTTRNSAACTMFFERTTPIAPAPIEIARAQKATFCAVMRASCSLLLPALGADFQRLRLGNGLHPLAELLLVVQEVGDVGLGVLVLGAPEQRVEGAHLHADAAVHAQRVVDVEAVEQADGAFPAALAAGRPLLLVALDVDAPVRALAGAEHAHSEVLFFERDDATCPRRWVLPLVRVLDRDGALEHGLERDAEAADQPRSLGFRELGHLERHLQRAGDENVRQTDRDQELPRHGLELILAQARVRESNPEHQERHEHHLGEQHDRAQH